MTVLKENLAKKLAEQEGKITRSMLASKAGISQASFSNIMTGEIKNPGVYIVAKIAKELNCSIDELIGRKAKKGKQKQDQQISDKVQIKPELALNTAMAVLDLLSKAKKEISFKEFLHVTEEVYKYNIGKNTKAAVDEYFAKWFIEQFINSKNK